jgi:anti-sigma-K factor RskA
VSNGHPVEDLAAYALGSLERTEYGRVERHVLNCASCAAQLRDYEGVIGALPVSLVPMPPPSEAWETIRAQARTRQVPSQRRTWPVLLPNWLRFARWPTVALALVALLFWNVTLQRELTRRSPGPAPGPEVEALSRRPGRIVILTGTGQPGASARIFLAVDGGGHLAVSGLAPLPGGRTYQLWFERTGSPAASGATFRVDAHGRAWVKVAAPATLNDVHAIVITDEAAPGSATPVGAHILDALPWR